MKYASIVPLIGGETLGMQRAFDGQRPEYLLSYSPFSNNDQHIVEYYKDVPYYLLDKGQPLLDGKPLDVINTVCPCAGLSALSPSSSSNAPANDWMLQTAKFVLEDLKPTVFWGENAPRLASAMGEPVVKKLRKIAKANGYTMMIYKTKSILHGLSQVRDRCFYFFFRGNTIPIFPYIDRDHERIEETIRGCTFNENDPMKILTNEKRPSKDPLYRYVLEVMHKNWTHRKFWDSIELTTNPLDTIEGAGISYHDVSKWLKSEGYPERLQAKCDRMAVKLASGGNIMRKGVEIAKDYIGAFVGHNPFSITHPDHDRFLTIRECLDIMCLPADFNLVGGLKNLNHICQNVPVTTAADMATFIKRYLGSDLPSMKVDFMVIDNKAQTRFIADGNVGSLEEFL